MMTEIVYAETYYNIRTLPIRFVQPAGAIVHG